MTDSESRPDGSRCGHTDKIAALRRHVADQDGAIASLRAQVTRLEARLARLEPAEETVNHSLSSWRFPNRSLPTTVVYGISGSTCH